MKFDGEGLHYPYPKNLTEIQEYKGEEVPWSGNIPGILGNEEIFPPITGNFYDSVP
jgi:hypothetical protein